MRKYSFRNIILGEKNYIEPEVEYRKALLVGFCAIVMLITSLIVGILNLFLWEVFFSYSFLIGIFGGFLVFFLNRFRRYKESQHALLLMAMFLVFVFMFNRQEQYGIQLYLFLILIGSLTLFGYKSVKEWLFYGLMALTLFIISELKQPQIENINVAQQDNIYFLNYIVTFAVLIIVTYFQLKLQDNSEQKILDQDREIKESEERFRLAVEGINAGIWVWENINNDQQWWSPKLYEFLGYDPKDFSPSKENFKSLLAEKSDYGRLASEFQKHLKFKEPFSVEFKLRCKDDSFKWFHGSGQAKRTNGEKPNRMVGSLIDITDKKTREEEIEEKNELLEHTNAELDRFVYSVSHDLRAPLNSIQGLMKVMEATDDVEEQNQFLDMMKNRIQKLHSFIDEIINFARNTRTEVVKKEVNLYELAQETFENSQYRELANEIEFKLNVEQELTLETDPSRLGVVLNNLVDNAVKYHRHNGKEMFVELRAEAIADEVIIDVVDNGQGIPQEAQNKIFDMFYRASDNAKGSGLGLYIVKDMVKRLGGSINLKSEIGQGTRFTIKLPKS